MERRNALIGLLGMAAVARGKSTGATWPDAVFTLDDGRTEHHSFGDNTVYFEGHTAQ
jgi:hypothetical protein